MVLASVAVVTLSASHGHHQVISHLRNKRGAHGPPVQRPPPVHEPAPVPPTEAPLPAETPAPETTAAPGPVAEVYPSKHQGKTYTVYSVIRVQEGGELPPGPYPSPGEPGSYSVVIPVVIPVPGPGGPAAPAKPAPYAEGPAPSTEISPTGPPVEGPAPEGYPPVAVEPPVESPHPGTYPAVEPPVESPPPGGYPPVAVDPVPPVEAHPPKY